MLFRSAKSGLRSRADNYNDQVDSDVGGCGNSRAGSGDGSKRRRQSKNTSNGGSINSPDLNAIWNELMSMKSVVEDDHDRKLRRIESDLRWTMTLVGGQFLTIIGAAVAMLAGG